MVAQIPLRSIFLLCIISMFNTVVAKADQFDPSLFQNPQFMSALYNGEFPRTKQFDVYMIGFATALGGEQFVSIDHYCKTLIPPSLTYQLNSRLANYSMGTVGDFSGNSNGKLLIWSEQGDTDALNLVNHYSCQSEVARIIVNNIIAASGGSVTPKRQTYEPTPAAAPPSTTTYRTPTMFNCAKASMGADYVICAFPDLLDAEADLEDAYTEAHNAGGNAVRSEQIEWMKNYGPDCGLPFRGRPSSGLIGSTHDCVLSAMRKRIAELRDQ